MTHFYSQKIINCLKRLFIPLFGFCLILASNASGFAQISPVTGRVLADEDGTGVPGVNILIKGKTIGTVTDIDGNYSINATGNETLIFSSIGYVTEEIPINGRSVIELVLKADIKSLDEVVVIGYGTQEKSDVTGAIGSVDDEDFNKGIIVSPEQLLQGKIAGVNVTSASGEPGAAMAITIRGPGSVRSGSSPLFVIDGVPLNNSSTTPSVGSIGLGSSGPSNPLNFLNPSDIASIDVLKDASATAIYGSRGANGVVIITTKRGVKGASRMSYSGSYGVSKIANKIDLLSAQEFIEFTNSQGNPENIRDSDTDWQDHIFRTAFTQDHNLSFMGGGQNTNYFAALSYMDQEGLIENSHMKRYTGRINADQSLLNERLNLRLNLTASFTNNNYPPTSDNTDATGDLLTNTLNANPTFPTHNSDGSFFNFPNGYNPLTLLDIYKDFTKVNRVLGNIEAGFEIIEGLEYKINFAVDNAHSSRTVQIDPHSIANLDNATGRLEDASSENTNLLFDNYLSYKFNLGKHNFSVLAGHSFQRYDFQARNWSINNFSTEEIAAYYNPGIGTSLDLTNNRPSGNAYRNELQSFFGRLSYDFFSKYLLTATVRADGSSKFGKENRYGVFSSFGGAWRVSEEEFLLGNEILSDLKLRIGWGQTGNQEIPPYITKGQLRVTNASGSGYPINDDRVSAGYNFVRTPNEDIKWEVSTQTNIGLDFGFFNNKLYGTIDYFKKQSKDILWRTSASADPINPTSEFWNNYDMEINNKGLELSLGYRHTGEDFSWEIGTNMTVIDNEIANSPVSILTTGNLSGPGLTGVPVNGYLNGQPIGTFYILDFIGFDENGENVFGDINNDGTINNEDRFAAGTALPEKLFSINGSLTYKSFDLSLNFNGVSGNKIYNNTENAYFNYPILAAGNNVSRNVLDNTKESTTNSATPSTRYLYDGSFFRLNNATIGYNLDTDKIAWLTNLRFYITGQNLFIITDYEGFDPEVNTPKNADGFLSYGIDFSSYPKARTIVFGVNVTF